MVLFSPFLIVIPLLILIEDGMPIFYFQERVGKDNKVFKLIKFRSMKKDAEKSGPQWAEVADTRVTKIGKILRKLHFDEIPQLINVFKGEISLVGPRAERPEFVKILEKEIPFYYLRHIIKPGITGWAQINFGYARSIEDSLKKFEYDLYYIKNRSLIFDLKIILKTAQIWFKRF
jgi:lipopolysaccharide/colanic/teichoic acid biosynthesis glycosyltransferase